MQEQESVFDEVCRKARGLTNLSRQLTGASVQVVSNWRDRGFPANRCKAIQRITGVSVRRLRPEDWAEYWPDEPPDDASSRGGIGTVGGTHQASHSARPMQRINSAI